MLQNTHERPTPTETQELPSPHCPHFQAARGDGAYPIHGYCTLAAGPGALMTPSTEEFRTLCTTSHSPHCPWREAPCGDRSPVRREGGGTTVRAIAGAAVYRWHLEGQRYVYVNPEIARVTGVPPEDLELKGRELWLERIHPQDRVRVETDVAAVLGGGRTTVVYRFRHRDGTYRTLMEHLYGAREGEGRTFLAGMLEDVTDQLAVVSTPAVRRGGGRSAGEGTPIPPRTWVTRRVAVGVAMAALLIMTLETGYLMGLRQRGWSGAETAVPANTPSGVQVASRAGGPGTAARAHGTKVTKRARPLEARAASPQGRHPMVRTRAATAPAVQPHLAASQATVVLTPPSADVPEPEAAALSRRPAAAPALPPPAEPAEETPSPSFWSRVAGMSPQPIAPDPPSLR